MPQPLTLITALLGLACVGLLARHARLAAAHRRVAAQLGASLRHAAEIHNLDPLTGLLTRPAFMQRLAALLSANPAPLHPGPLNLALAIIDLDQFKSINTQLGRPAGDHLLHATARRLANTGPDSLLTARLSGDKFAVLARLPSTAHCSTSGANNSPEIGGAPLACLLKTVFGTPFQLHNQSITLSMSAGVALHTAQTSTAEALLAACEQALQRAIAQGGGTCVLHSPHLSITFTQPKTATTAITLPPFTPALLAPPLKTPIKRRACLTESQRLTQDLRGALARSEISVAYQPFFHAHNLTLAGFEALARWHHPQNGPIPPAIFIKLAEDAGFISDIGTFVLATACQDIVASRSPLKIAVNLSPLQFNAPGLITQLAHILAQTGLPPAQLELEVTESLLIENATAARTALTAIRATGIGVALDDFGTGYSAFSYLCELPFSRLKIDRRFTQSIEHNSATRAVITAILSLARNLNLAVTAEGVETEAQLAFLRSQGCEMLQGFLLGRPAPYPPLASPQPAQPAQPAPSAPPAQAIQATQPALSLAR